MPYEIERKFVIKLESEDYFLAKKDKSWLIEQGYIQNLNGVSIRVRSKQYSDSKASYYLTNKFPHDDKKCIEIETAIYMEDFYLLWAKTTNRLLKRRYMEKITYPIVINGENRTGRAQADVDFFLDSENKVYFALAEIELSQYNLELPPLPKWLSDNLIYQVPWEDKRFSSYKLSNITYARNLLQELQK